MEAYPPSSIEVRRSAWKTVAFTTASIAGLAIAGTVAFVYSGVFNVAATDPHSDVMYRLMEFTRKRSIAVRASGLEQPMDSDTEPKIVGAAGHFAAHCATCHGGPGIDREEFAKGMYPAPPDLTKVAERYSPGELFWILKNGIKMSGMPSMADDGDEMLWSTVSFLQKLPTMSADDYNDLWMASQAQGGMSHMMNMGGMNMPGMNMTPGASDAPKTDNDKGNTKP